MLRFGNPLLTSMTRRYHGRVIQFARFIYRCRFIPCSAVLSCPVAPSNARIAADMHKSIYCMLSTLLLLPPVRGATTSVATFSCLMRYFARRSKMSTDASRWRCWNAVWSAAPGRRTDGRTKSIIIARKRGGMVVVYTARVRNLYGQNRAIRSE